MLGCALAHAEPSVSVRLAWTTPGDDSLAGTATAFDLRYGLEPITLTSFQNATRVMSLSRPGPPGTIQRVTIDGLMPTTSYYFALRTADERGNWSGIASVRVNTGGLPVPPGPRGLVGVAPNPAVDHVWLDLDLDHASEVELEAFDATGRCVRTLARGMQRAGASRMFWSLSDDRGTRLAPGTYWIRSRAGSHTTTRRVTVTR